MPLPAPPLDHRRYQDLVSELIARIPVHTPEWTNFNASDPGITLIQLFAHLGESMIYRTNQIPDRNRMKFLELLGIGLQPAREARGLVAFSNENGPPGQVNILAGTELAASKIAFRTDRTLDVLQVEPRYYMKQAVAPTQLDQATRDYHSLLYASYGQPEPDGLALYSTAAVDFSKGFDFAAAQDRTLWIALCAPAKAVKDADGSWGSLRESLAKRTLSFGLIPDLGEAGRNLPVVPQVPAAGSSPLSFALPDTRRAATPSGADSPAPSFVELVQRLDFDPLHQAGVIELTLPDAAGLGWWDKLDPLEAGVGELPPLIDNQPLADKIVTWLRVRAGASAALRLTWAGINAAQVRQRVEVRSERLADGDGTPDQERRLGRAPVLPGSVTLTGASVTMRRTWRAIDDIMAAGPEVPVVLPGTMPEALGATDVFTLDAEAGIVRFGDGLTGRRPPQGEALYADYAYCEGREGNVGPGAILASPAVPDGITVTNPVATWGGADGEDARSGEKQVQRLLQTRDRLVTAEDFRTIAWRTPGVAIGRVEVVPASHPDVAPVSAGTVPGAVTLMAIPASDGAHPNSPRPDRVFVDAMCSYLDPRRLVTTELAIRGPDYVGVWISVGIEMAGGHSAAEVTELVRERLKAYLSPLPAPGFEGVTMLPLLYAPDSDAALRGWPLGRAVNARTLLAEVARVSGVVSVADVLLARGSAAQVETVPLSGLELPEVLGISVVAGDPVPLDQLRGTPLAPVGISPRLPVPIMAETC